MMALRRVAFKLTLLASTMCCLSGVLLLNRATAKADEELRNVTSQARQLRMPLTGNNLEGARIEEDQNAAHIYWRSMILANRPLISKAQKSVDGAFNKPFDEGQQAPAEALLPALSPLLSLLDRLDSAPYCDFERNWNTGAAINFPELTLMRSLVRDLCLRASYQDRHGDTVGALRTMKLANRVTKDCGSDPILLAMLVQAACRNIVSREWEVLIERHSHDGHFLREAERVINQSSQLPDERYYLGGEVVMGLQGVSLLSSAADLRGEASNPDEPSRRVNPLEKSFFRSKVVQDTLKTNIVRAWMPIWQRLPAHSQDWELAGRALDEMGRKIQHDQTMMGRFNQVLVPVFTHLSDTVGTLQAHDRLLLVAIRLLLARVEVGRLPDELPTDLGDIAVDPFDGKPLRFRRKGAGFVLYSIGRDRKDDGGRRRQPNGGKNGSDEVVEFS